VTPSDGPPGGAVRHAGEDRRPTVGVHRASAAAAFRATWCGRAVDLPVVGNEDPLPFTGRRPVPAPVGQAWSGHGFGGARRSRG
jgi:hypothetical protein